MTRTECAEHLRDFLRHREMTAHNRPITFFGGDGETTDVTFTPENDLYHQVLTAALKYVEITDEELIILVLERGLKEFIDITPEELEKALEGSNWTKVKP